MGQVRNHFKFRKSLGDLSGLKVAHDVDDFVEGQDTILVLKDSKILENEGIFFILTI